MNSESRRPYRKNVETHGLIYMGGEEQDIILLNVSVTGALARLNKKEADMEDVSSLFNTLRKSTKCDLYIPKLHIAGEAEIVRVDMNETHLLLALEFRNISYNIDNRFYKRRVYRKELSVSGKIVLNGEPHDFETINVSVEGLMIQLAKAITVEEGTITTFEFNKAALKGEVQVMWVEYISDTETLMGLQYINMKTRITGIPRFAQ